ncbi:MAG: glycosyltransferase family 2 protein [Cyclobacteriaceae bacterium]
MSKVTLSIITVTYNAEKYVEQTIKSVLNQTFKDLEYLIVDGESTDRTLEIIGRFQDKIDLVISDKDSGVYDAMNKGLQMAHGEYILFLNAGDELSKPTVFEEIFDSKQKADIYYGETNILNKDRKVIGTRTELTSRKLPGQLIKKDFLNGQVVSHQSFIPKRSLATPYNLKYQCSADIDWMLQIISRSKKIVNVNQPISNYLQGGISDTQLGRCWRERFMILMKYFDPLAVILAHFRFFARFFVWGRYK